MHRSIVYLSGLPNDALTIASGCELMMEDIAVITVHPWAEYASSMGYALGDISSLAESLIERCDAVLFVPGWELSAECQLDLLLAEDYGVEIYYSIDELKKTWGLE